MNTAAPASDATAALATRRVNRYLLAVIGLSFIGVTAVVLIAWLRGDKDNTALYATVVSFIGPTTATLLAYMIRDTHMLVNGEMSSFRHELRAAAIGRVEQARNVGLAEGTIVGADRANARTDAIADAQKPPTG